MEIKPSSDNAPFSRVGISVLVLMLLVHIKQIVNAIPLLREDVLSPVAEIAVGSLVEISRVVT